MAAAASESQSFEIMRTAFDRLVTRAPLEYATLDMKAYLFQCILEAAARGETSLEGLMASATERMQDIILLLSSGYVFVEHARRNPSSRREANGEV
jgi:hypothetical protein